MRPLRQVSALRQLLLLHRHFSKFIRQSKRVSAAASPAVSWWQLRFSWRWETCSCGNEPNQQECYYKLWIGGKVADVKAHRTPFKHWWYNFHLTKMDFGSMAWHANIPSTIVWYSHLRRCCRAYTHRLWIILFLHQVLIISRTAKYVQRHWVAVTSMGNDVRRCFSTGPFERLAFVNDKL